MTGAFLLTLVDQGAILATFTSLQVVGRWLPRHEHLNQLHGFRQVTLDLGFALHECLGRIQFAVRYRENVSGIRCHGDLGGGMRALCHSSHSHS